KRQLLSLLLFGFCLSCSDSEKAPSSILDDTASSSTSLKHSGYRESMPPPVEPSVVADEIAFSDHKPGYAGGEYEGDDDEMGESASAPEPEIKEEEEADVGWDAGYDRRSNEYADLEGALVYSMSEPDADVGQKADAMTEYNLPAEAPALGLASPPLVQPKPAKPSPTFTGRALGSISLQAKMNVEKKQHEALYKQSSVQRWSVESRKRKQKVAEKKKAQRRAKLRQASAGIGSADKGVSKLSQLPSVSWLDEISQLENLDYQDATGYWRNTYLPGDQQFRALHFKLSELSQPSQQASRIYQPFDQPDHAALSLYLSSSKATVQGKTRMLFQVGVKGNERGRGSRPRMNVGIVLDLTQATTAQTQEQMSALLKAFVQTKQIGDQFSLTIAGKRGGMIIRPKQFQYGAMKLAQDYVFADGKQPNDSLERLTLQQAMQQATKTVGTEDDPTAPLGASLVILITPNDLMRQVKPLVELAHASAVQGIPHSVIGVGHQVNQRAIDQIILAGQGNRRLLTEVAEAKGLVSREMNAISRVIARAIRLNIRLLPKVKLVGILGSEKLSQKRADRVRAMENSIDLRLAKNLGIKSDRGKDDAGIQIVIPAFYSNDEHVILLDVVTESAQAIADVEIKYKDLVFSKNNVMTVRYALPNTPMVAGALQKNVVKNYIAYQLSNMFEQAAERVRSGQRNKAINLVRAYQQKLQQLPEWMDSLNDPDIQRDIALLEEYGLWMHRQSRRVLMDSLQYASFAKRLSKPVE
ncbi:MAG: VWA domain-containing protein, partial [Methylococcales bacterium]|nr:VWA domain-containing protein [Methylococcales bacterium]